MNELINKLNQYRSTGDKFYPEDIVVIEDIWALIDEIERLNNDIKVLLKENENKEKVIKAQDNIINEAINYIDDNTYYKDHKGHINIDDLYIILQKGSDKE